MILKIFWPVLATLSYSVFGNNYSGPHFPIANVKLDDGSRIVVSTIGDFFSDEIEFNLRIFSPNGDPEVYSSADAGSFIQRLEAVRSEHNYFFRAIFKNIAESIEEVNWGSSVQEVNYDLSRRQDLIAILAETEEEMSTIEREIRDLQRFNTESPLWGEAGQIISERLDEKISEHFIFLVDQMNLQDLISHYDGQNSGFSEENKSIQKSAAR